MRLVFRPWTPQADPMRGTMSFLNFTKYPPSLDFLLLTLGCGLVALARIARIDTAATRAAAVFGGAPLFSLFSLFCYLLHLYALLGLQKLASAVLGGGRARAWVKYF